MTQSGHPIKHNATQLDHFNGVYLKDSCLALNLSSLFSVLRANLLSSETPVVLLRGTDLVKMVAAFS